jgi:hypothetical protein
MAIDPKILTVIAHPAEPFSFYGEVLHTWMVDGTVALLLKGEGERVVLGAIDQRLNVCKPYAGAMLAITKNADPDDEREPVIILEPNPTGWFVFDLREEAK